jgi:hypothetical protein
MTEISTRPVSEMTLDELEREYDSLPRNVENLDEWKPVKARRKALAQEFNGRNELPIEVKAGIRKKRVLTET